MTTPAACPSFAGYPFQAEIISHAVWVYFRFPLSLRMVEDRGRLRTRHGPADLAPPRSLLLTPAEGPSVPALG